MKKARIKQENIFEMIGEEAQAKMQDGTTLEGIITHSTVDGRRFGIEGTEIKYKDVTVVYEN